MVVVVVVVMVDWISARVVRGVRCPGGELRSGWTLGGGVDSGWRTVEDCSEPEEVGSGTRFPEDNSGSRLCGSVTVVSKLAENVSSVSELAVKGTSGSKLAEMVDSESRMVEDSTP